MSAREDATGTNSLLFESSCLILLHPPQLPTSTTTHHANLLSTMPVIIDHTAYPYIIDLIIDHSHVTTLLNFRAT